MHPRWPHGTAAARPPMPGRAPLRPPPALRQAPALRQPVARATPAASGPPLVAGRAHRPAGRGRRARRRVRPPGRPGRDEGGESSGHPVRVGQDAGDAGEDRGGQGQGDLRRRADDRARLHERRRPGPRTRQRPRPSAGQRLEVPGVHHPGQPQDRRRVRVLPRRSRDSRRPSPADARRAPFERRPGTGGLHIARRSWSSTLAPCSTSSRARATQVPGTVGAGVPGTAGAGVPGTAPRSTRTAPAGMSAGPAASAGPITRPGSGVPRRPADSTPGSAAPSLSAVMHASRVSSRIPSSRARTRARITMGVPAMPDS